MPQSHLSVLEGVGHYPHVQEPEAVVDIIDSFMRATAGVA